MMDTNIQLFRLINDLGFHIPALNPVFIFIAEYFLYLLIIILIYYLFKDNNMLSKHIESGPPDKPITTVSLSLSKFFK